MLVGTSSQTVVLLTVKDNAGASATNTITFGITGSIPVFSLAATRVVLLENATNTIRHQIQVNGIVGEENASATFSVTSAGSLMSANPTPVVSFNSARTVVESTLSNTARSATLYFSVAPDQTGVATLTVTLSDISRGGISYTQSMVVQVNVATNTPVISAAIDMDILANIRIYGGHLYARSAFSISEGGVLPILALLEDFPGHLAIPETGEELLFIDTVLANFASSRWLGIASTNANTYPFTLRYDYGTTGLADQIYAVVNSEQDRSNILPGHPQYTWSNSPPQPGTTDFASSYVVVSGLDEFVVLAVEPGATLTRYGTFELPEGFPAITSTVTNVFNEDASLARAITLSGFDLDGEAFSSSAWSLTVSTGAVEIDGQISAVSTGIQQIPIGYTPPADFSGTATITVGLSDGVSTTTAYLLVPVLPVNDAPTVSLSNVTQTNVVANGNSAIFEDFLGVQEIVVLQDLDEGDGLSGLAQQPFSFSIQTSGSTSVLESGTTIVYTVGATTAALRFDPVLGSSGNVTLSITVQDDGGTLRNGEDSTTVTVVIQVRTINFAPSADSASLVIAEDSSYTVVSAGVITDFDDNNAGVTQNITLSLTNIIDDSDILVSTPTISSSILQDLEDATLTFSFNPNSFGTATISYMLQDDGSTLFGGVDSSTGSFLVVVTPVNDTPTIGVTQFNILENDFSPPNVITVVGQINASDADESDSLSYALSGAGAAGFSISSTGVLRLNANQELDFESTSSYTFVIAVGDGVATATANAQVSVLNSTADAGIILTSSSPLTVSEDSSTTATLQTRLASVPEGTVTLLFDGGTSLLIEGNATHSLTFSTANWSTAQLVTLAGRDNFIDEGVSYTELLTISVASQQSGNDYINFVSNQTTQVVVIDNDVAAVLPSPTFASVSEDGDLTTQVSVVLATQPTGTVQIVLLATPLAGDLSHQIMLNGSTSVVQLNFTSSNWNIPQTVLVTAIDDAINDQNVISAISYESAATSSGFYRGLAANQDTEITAIDNDEHGFTISPTTGTVSEAGGTAIFNIALRLAPTGSPLILHPDFLDGSVNQYAVIHGTNGTLSASVGLAFSTDGAGNTFRWNSSQSVTVVAIDDSIDEDKTTYALTFTPSGNIPYINVPDFESDVYQFTIDDNDTAGITLAPQSFSLSESSAQSAIFVVLDAQPESTVSLTIVASEVVLSPESTKSLNLSTNQLLFTSANWDITQSFTVTAQNNVIDDGDATVTVSLSSTVQAGASTNTRLHWSGTSSVSADSMVRVVDDDESALVVSALSTDTLYESSATQATFTVRLATRPFSTVTVNVLLSDDSLSSDPEATLSADSLTFTATGNSWQTLQSVTITVVDDDFDDDTRNATVTLSVVSSDALYSGLSPTARRFEIIDDDVRGVRIAPTEHTVTEEGSVSTAEVRLATRPYGGDVTLEVSSAHTFTSGVIPIQSSLSTARIVFTTSNWSTSITVTVSAYDDEVVDNTQYSKFSLVASGGDYGSSENVTLTVTVTDDDVAGFVVAPTSLIITEEAGSSRSATFEIRPQTQPLSTVTLSVASTQVRGLAQLELSGQNTNSQSSILLSFTSATWNTSITVSVEAIDNQASDDGVFVTLTLTVVNGGSGYSAATTLSDVIVEVIDDERPGYSLSRSTASVTEGGVGSIFTVVLTAEPVSGVTVFLSPTSTLSGQSTRELTFSTNTIVFSSANARTPVSITVTAVNDDIDEDDESIQVFLIATDSINGAYANNAGFSGDTLTVTVVDNDTAGIELSGSPVVTEPNTTDSLLVRLSAQPESTVVLSFSTGSIAVGGSIILSTTSVIFSPYPSNSWNTLQSIVVTAVDDNFDDGTQTVVVTADSAVVANADLNTISHWAGANSVSSTHGVLVVDDDESALVVSALSADTLYESSATQATFTVRLATRPFSTVTVNVLLSDDSLSSDPEATLSADSLTFTATGNSWQTLQSVTITVVDDDFDDDTRNATVTLSVASSDALYSGLLPTARGFETIDDDVRGVQIAPTEHTVTEGGSVSTAEVRLATRPYGGDVMLEVSSAHTFTSGVIPIQSSLSTARIVFTTSNWSTSITVTVSAYDDEVVDNTQYSKFSLAASGGDYGSSENVTLTVTVTDDDVAGFVVVPTSLIITEEAGSSRSATFEIRPQTQPLSTVTLSVASTQVQGLAQLELSGQNTNSQSSILLSFTSATWNTSITVSVEAIDDQANDDGVFVTLTLTVVNGGSGYSAATTLSDVIVEVIDDESPGYSLSRSTASVTEGGVGSIFTVVLTADPPGSATVALSPSATLSGQSTRELTFSTNTIVFSSANARTPVSITVTAVNDDIDEDDESIQVFLIATDSINGAYASNADFSGDTLTVTVVDNDTAGIELSGSPVVTEPNTTDSLLVRLSAQPESTVVLSFSTGSIAVGGSIILSTTSVVFSPYPSNSWNTLQSIVVTAVDDNFDDGTQTVVVTADSAVVANADLNTISHWAGANSVSSTHGVLVVDDDESALIVSALSTDTLYESSATQATFTVRLATRPFSTVTVNVLLSDDSLSSDPEATLSADSLTFTATGNSWQTLQSVTITVVDDDFDDDTRNATVTLSVASSDALYSGLLPTARGFETIDNDVRGVQIAPTEHTVTEGGSVSTAEVRLATRPYGGDVTLEVSSAHTFTSGVIPIQSSLSTARIVFTTSNWSTSITVTVSAYDDEVVDNTQYSTFSLAASGGDYGSSENVTLTVTVTDDDVAGFVVVPTSLLITEEAGSSRSATFEIRPQTQPLSTVTLSVASTQVQGLAQVELSGQSTNSQSSILLSFTSATWNTSITVSVEAIDDQANDDGVFVTLTLTVVNGDSGYSAATTLSDVIVEVIDDERPGYSFSRSTASVTEGGVGSIFTVVLTADPPGSATVALSPSATLSGQSTRELTFSTNTIVFSSANARTPVSITVTAVNDDIDEDDESIQVFLIATDSINGAYASNADFSGDTLTVTVVDNDTAGIELSGSPVVTEPNTTDSLLVRLSAQPESTVVLSFSTGSIAVGGSIILSTTSVVFSPYPSNSWNTLQSIVVTAVDDNFDDGTQTVVVTADSAVVANADLNTISHWAGANSVSSTHGVLVVDDDESALVVSALSTDTLYESSATQATFTVRLATRPFSTVTVNVLLSDDSLSSDPEATLSVDSLTFTATGNSWQTLQSVTITVVDDDFDDDTRNATVTLSVASSDALYSGLPPTARGFETIDDDVRGVQIAPTEHTVTEGGSVSTAEVRLATRPYGGDVTLEVSSAHTFTSGVIPIQSSLSTARIVFTTSNWSTSITVTVSAYDDEVVDNTQYSTFSLAASGGDYGSSENVTLTVTVTDDDVAGFVVVPTSLLITEEAGSSRSATFEIRPQTQPLSTVTLSVASTQVQGLAQLELSGQSTNSQSSILLSFTSATWNTSITVSVEAIDDQANDDGVFVTLTLTVVNGDSGYSAATTLSDVIVEVIDDESPGYSFSRSTASVTEGGVGSIFTVVLTADPPGSATVALSPSATLSGQSTRELTFSTNTIVFSSANARTPVSITVTAVNDDIDEDDESIQVFLIATDSINGAYASNADFSGDTLTVTVVDNDTAGIELSGSPVVTEPNTTDSLLVRLSAQPESTVVLSFSTGSIAVGGSIILSTTSVVFSPYPSNSWNTLQSIVVTAVDDNFDDGTQTVVVTADSAVVANADLNTISHWAGANSVSSTHGVLVVDDDESALIVSALSTDTLYESSATQATFTVRLATRPFSTVTVNVLLSDDSLSSDPEATLSVDSLTFTATGNSWQTLQSVTITVVDDDFDDDTRNATVTLSVASSDALYSGLLPTARGLETIDDDVRGVQIAPTEHTVTEGGSVSTAEVRLATRPYGGDVTLEVSSAHTFTSGVIPIQSSLSTARIVFTTSNWSTSITVTVSAYDDEVVDNTQYSTFSLAASGGDYGSSENVTLTVTVTDDDVAGFVVVPTSLLITEEAGSSRSATFEIRPQTQPLSTVTLSVASTQVQGLAQLELSGQSTNSQSSILLSFTSATWNTSITVSVEAIDDQANDDGVFVTLTLTVVNGDSGYSVATTLSDVIVEVIDDESPGYSLSRSTASVTEGGVGSIFTVVLTADPPGSATVALSPSATLSGQSTRELTFSTNTIVFSSANARTPVSITVTAVNDDIDEDDESIQVFLIATDSINGAYASNADFSGDTLTVTVVDNDTAGIELSGSPVVTEPNTTDSLLVRLSAQPESTVVLSFSTGSIAVGGSIILSTTSVVFSPYPSNSWNTLQSIVVTAVDDNFDDGTQTVVVTADSAVVANADLNTISHWAGANSVSSTHGVLVVDDDESALIVSALSTDTLYESSATQATFTVRLATRPFSTVTVNVLLSDDSLFSGSEATLSVDSLTFTATGNSWQTLQSVTITVVDDDFDDDTRNATVTLSVVSSDALYSGLPPTARGFETIDDDVRGVRIAPTEHTVTEGGSVSTAEVRLATRPYGGDVTLEVSSAHTFTSGVIPIQSSLSTAQIVFTTSNWSTSITVTVSAYDDEVVDNTQYSTFSLAASGGDYGSSENVTLTVTVTDDDVAGFVVVPTSLIITEEAGSSRSATFEIRPQTQPLSTVTLSVASTQVQGLAQLELSGQSTNSQSSILLSFTSVTWNTPITVSVEAIDDQANDDGVFVTLTLTVVNGGSGYSAATTLSDVIVEVIDDESPGYSLSRTTASVTEGGGGSTFTVVLTAEPVSGMTVFLSPTSTLSGQSTRELTFSTNTIRFSDSSAFNPVTVTITAFDDFIDEDDETVDVYFIASATAAGYVDDPQFLSSTLTVTIIDNDTAGIELSGSPVVTEPNTTDSLLVRLSAQPESTVVLSFSTGSIAVGGSIILSTTSVVFSPYPSNSWNTLQSIVVTAVDDDFDDGTQTVVVTADSAVVANADLNTISHWAGANSVSSTHGVLVVDDDESALIVSALSTDTLYESSATQATFTVRLATRPFSTVTVNVLLSDDSLFSGSEATLSVDSLTFTATGNSWQTLQSVTITVVDDDFDDDTRNATVTLSVASSDALYSGLPPTARGFETIDDDVRGVQIAPTEHTVTEGGAVSTAEVRLATRPYGGDVTLEVSSAHTFTSGVIPIQSSLSTARIVFTTSNWSTSITVTVSAYDDEVVDNTQYSTFSLAASGGDYGSSENVTLTVTVTDDDVAGFVVVPTSLLITEEAGSSRSATFEIRPQTQPLSTVTLSVASTQVQGLAQLELSGQNTNSQSSILLSFTSATWNTSITVSVEAIDDQANDDGVFVTLTLTVVNGDSGYSVATTLSDVIVEVIDDERPGYSLSRTTASVTEGGGGSTFTVVLTAEPVSGMTVFLSPTSTLSGQSTRELTFSTNTIRFSDSSAFNPVTVTITAFDDFIDEDNETVDVYFIASATAAGYADDPQFLSSTLTVTIIDNDTAGIELSGSPVVTEPNTTDSLLVRLSAQPEEYSGVKFLVRAQLQLVALLY